MIPPNTLRHLLWTASIPSDSNDYNYVYLILMILCFVVIALIAGWMTLAKVFENRAFKKATNLSNMIYLTERHRVELEWQEWKMNNRSY